MSETKNPLPNAGDSWQAPNGIHWHVDNVTDSTIYLSRKLIAGNPDTHGDKVEATLPVAAWDDLFKR